MQQQEVRWRRDRGLINGQHVQGGRLWNTDSWSVKKKWGTHKAANVTKVVNCHHCLKHEARKANLIKCTAECLINALILSKLYRGTHCRESEQEKCVQLHLNTCKNWVALKQFNNLWRFLQINLSIHHSANTVGLLRNLEETPPDEAKATFYSRRKHQNTR